MSPRYVQVVLSLEITRSGGSVTALRRWGSGGGRGTGGGKAEAGGRTEGAGRDPRTSLDASLHLVCPLGQR